MTHRAGISVSVRGRLGGERPRERDADEPFRLLLLADFSGRGQRQSIPPLTRPRRADVGALDELFASFGAELQLPTPEGGLDIFCPRSLEDLHPDALLANLPSLSEAYELLRELNSARVSADAVGRARSYVTRVLGSAPRVKEEAPREASDTSTLERLLGRAPSASTPAAAPSPESPLSALLEDAVRAHKVDAPSAERDLLKNELERVLTLALGRVLHSPGFQSLEAAWRGADRVIRALDTDESLHIALFDISMAELVATFSSVEDPETSELHRLLVKDSAGWTLVAAGMEFGSSDSELTALAGLGALSARAGGALLAGASPALFDCSAAPELSLPRVWAEQPPPALFHALRESPLAERIGLVAPRLLARARYGKKSEAIESFPFEELADPATDLSARPWSSAAFGVAELIGRAFRENGWGYSDTIAPSLTDLPCETVELDGERILFSPSEAFLDQRAAEALLARGVMSFLARRDAASLRLLQLASIAEPRRALVGIDSNA